MSEERTKALSPSAEALQARRESVRKILATGGVAASAIAAGKWTRPVVESVLLPAHAVTTGEQSVDVPLADPSLVPTDPCGVVITCGTADNSIDIEINGFITPAIGGVTVELDIDLVPAPGTPLPPVQVFTDGAGVYTHTELDVDSILEVTVTASLPDFPAGGTTVCTVGIGDEGDNTDTPEENSYFCD